MFKIKNKIPFVNGYEKSIILRALKSYKDECTNSLKQECIQKDYIGYIAVADYLNKVELVIEKVDQI